PRRVAARAQPDGSTSLDFQPSRGYHIVLGQRSEHRPATMMRLGTRTKRAATRNTTPWAFPGMAITPPGSSPGGPRDGMPWVAPALPDARTRVGHDSLSRPAEKGPCPAANTPAEAGAPDQDGRDAEARG